MSRSSDIANLFKAVPEVRAVHVAQRFGVTNVHVLVSMPKYNDEVMDALVETEMKANGILGASYHFIPVEVADPFYLTPKFLGGQVWAREPEEVTRGHKKRCMNCDGNNVNAPCTCCG